MRIEFFVPGKPVAKQRPRFTSRGKFGRAFTPPETVNYEALVKMCALEASRPDLPMESAVGVVLTIHVERPRSAPKRVRYPVKRPDADNVVKSILDGMNGILYRDDSQVVTGRWEKIFAVDEKREGVHVQVTYFEEVE